MNLPPKVCPECGEEYVHRMTECVHCEVPLRLHGEPAPVRGAGLPDLEALECIRTAGSGWAVALSDRLRDVGIPHRVEPVGDAASGPSAAYGIFVRAEDAEAARAHDADFLREQMPDLPRDFDPSAAGGTEAAEEESCPACGTHVGAASECSECGLFLGG